MSPGSLTGISPVGIMIEESLRLYLDCFQILSLNRSKRWGARRKRIDLLGTPITAYMRVFQESVSFP